MPTQFNPGDRVHHPKSGSYGTVHHVNRYNHPVVIWDGDPDEGQYPTEWWSVEVVAQ